MTARWRPPKVDGVDEAEVDQLVVGALVDVALRLDLLVVGEAVHLVDEHLELDVRVDLVGARHGHVQPHQRLHVVVLTTAGTHIAQRRSMHELTVFCPGFQKGRVSKKDIFSFQR